MLSHEQEWAMRFIADGGESPMDREGGAHLSEMGA